MTDRDYSKVLWTDDEGNTHLGPFTIVWERPFTPAERDALELEIINEGLRALFSSQGEPVPPEQGRLMDYWPLETDESEHDNG